MFAWTTQVLDYVNETPLAVIDPGPLHAPILGYSVRRTQRRGLVVETKINTGAKPCLVQPADGMARYSTETVSLADESGRHVVLSGVVTRSITDVQPGSRQEVAQVHDITIEVISTETAYTIEWLENLPASPFIWPHTISTSRSDDPETHIVLRDEGLSVRGPGQPDGLSVSALRLVIQGTTLFLCADRRGSAGTEKSGAILYAGTPDDAFRKKIRTALSLTLGVYLVQTGHAAYDTAWRFLGGTARSAYSLSGQAVHLASMPLAHLSDRNFKDELGLTRTTRMVEALVASYERLDLGNLAWAYWHARCSTVHIAPAQFGAAIEALLRAYEEGQADRAATTILDRPAWAAVRRAVEEVITSAAISDAARDTLKKNIARLNEATARNVLSQTTQRLGVDLGSDEGRAWRSRHLAAHGRPIQEGKELEAIRDMKLLRGLLHRILLATSQAADTYVDYASAHFPVRPLKDAPPSNAP